MDYPFSDSNRPAQNEIGRGLTDQASQSMSQKSISNWVEQIGLGFRNICLRHNIEIAMDLEEVSDTVEPKPIKDAIIAMINNAIEAMPNGGDLEVTLLNGDHQWEIEVADSGPHRSQMPRDRGPLASPPNQTPNSADVAEPTDLPLVEPFEATRHLQNMESFALELGATLQTWNCPLGGTAHVMIVPKKQYPVTNQDNQTSGLNTSLVDGLPNNDRREAA